VPAAESVAWHSVIPQPSTDRSVNVSSNLLRSRVPDLPESAEEVADRLARAGFPVARIVPLAELLRAVVVGRVEAVAQHPNADRLKVCVVDDGTEHRLQIVTGAHNVRADAFYPVIRGGTTLPNGTKIKRGKLRGEVSEGMLGSADELELGTEHAGLLTLADGLTPGTPLPDAIPVEGSVFVLEGRPELDEVVVALGGARSEPAIPAQRDAV
jgi:phenylalanyl-tRNA synthetase beta chain